MQTHGIQVDVPLDKFLVGTSFFVPGVDRDKLEAHIRREMKRMKIPVVIRQVVENRTLGVRVWRMPKAVV